jgi:predicted peroxiredoxin
MVGFSHLSRLRLLAPAFSPFFPKKSILVRGSDDPTKAAFPFLHANAFAEADHEVQIFLLGEAVGLMRSCLAEAVVPVGWPPLAETLTKTIELGTNIHI